MLSRESGHWTEFRCVFRGSLWIGSRVAFDVLASLPIPFHLFFSADLFSVISLAPILLELVVAADDRTIRQWQSKFYSLAPILNIPLHLRSIWFPLVFQFFWFLTRNSWSELIKERESCGSQSLTVDLGAAWLNKHKQLVKPIFWDFDIRSK